MKSLKLQMKSLKRTVLWGSVVLLVVGALCFSGVLLAKAHMKGALRALNCMDASPEKIRLVIANESARQVFEPIKGEATVLAEIHFNLARSAMEDVQMFMTSYKSGRMVYRGPYKAILKIQAGEALMEHDGMDTFRFVFVNAKKGLVCSGEQEVGGRAWRSDRPALIEFLPYRELDDDIHTPIMWNIR